MEASGLRNRKNSKEASNEVAEPAKVGKTNPTNLLKDPRVWKANFWWVNATLLVVFLSIATRMWQVQHPNEVVFDEVHFGKFASYYLRRTYYFDVHPPLGKMLLALVGYFLGYDGSYLFDAIGDKYEEHNVPYVGFRLFTAFCGATIPVTSFFILKEMGLSIFGCLFGAALLIFDTALIAQSRFILLDSMLVMFCTFSLYSWVKFYRLRYKPFTSQWWIWLSLTGVCIACTTGVKIVGLLTMLAIGLATACDLWKLLDYKRGLSTRDFAKHFGARALCLILLPLVLYMSFFWAHFKVLKYSGPGDAFMSPEFRVTLEGNDMGGSVLPVIYYSNITLRNVQLNSFLHSHVDRYPLRYQDKRVSSQGQQITGYHHKDINNLFVVEPADCALYRPDLPEDASDELVVCERARDSMKLTPGIHVGVRSGDYVRFRHVLTNSYVMTHDVASPLTTTNMEFTTIEATKGAEKYNDTVFRLDLVGGFAGSKKPENSKGNFLRTKTDYVNVVSYQHDVCMFNSKSKLPEWGFGQLEINGNRNCDLKNNQWLVDSMEHAEQKLIEEEWKELTAKEKSLDTSKVRPSFFRKFIELQSAMLHHNSGLVKSHPFQSQPVAWPLLLRGISFWESKPEMKQVYLIGNPVVWWLNAICLVGFAVIWVTDRIFDRRGSKDISPKLRMWFDRSAGFIFVSFLAHYLPFYMQGRSLFLHHYFQAFISSCLLTAIFVDAMGRLLTINMFRDSRKYVGFHELPIVGQHTVYQALETDSDGADSPSLKIFSAKERVVARVVNELKASPNQPFPLEIGLGKLGPLLRQQYATVGHGAYIAVIVVTAALIIYCFLLFAPFSYGTGFGRLETANSTSSLSYSPGMTVEEIRSIIQSRKWLKTWDFMTGK